MGVSHARERKRERERERERERCFFRSDKVTELMCKLMIIG